MVLPRHSPCEGIDKVHREMRNNGMEWSYPPLYLFVLLILLLCGMCVFPFEFRPWLITVPSIETWFAGCLFGALINFTDTSGRWLPSISLAGLFLMVLKERPGNRSISTIFLSLDKSSLTHWRMSTRNSPIYACKQLHESWLHNLAWSPTLTVLIGLPRWDNRS